MRACLEKGIGFTICPAISVEEALQKKSLVRLAWREEGDEASLIMIWHSEKWCSPLLHRFMILSEDIMSESPKNGNLTTGQKDII